MVAKKLVSIRVLENDWDDFRDWADSQGSNATAELNRYIRQCLNRNDNDNETVQTVYTISNDSDIQAIKTAIATLSEEIERLKKSELAA
jgi:uncharacterized small protein (DUF1192 family)